jgi:hypothetical protein
VLTVARENDQSNKLLVVEPSFSTQVNRKVNTETIHQVPNGTPTTTSGYFSISRFVEVLY